MTCPPWTGPPVRRWPAAGPWLAKTPVSSHRQHAMGMLRTGSLSLPTTPATPPPPLWLVTLICDVTASSAPKTTVVGSQTGLSALLLYCMCFLLFAFTGIFVYGFTLSLFSLVHSSLSSVGARCVLSCRVSPYCLIYSRCWWWFVCTVCCVCHTCSFLSTR